jgi:Ca2+-binding EF-hand superfamily protein
MTITELSLFLTKLGVQLESKNLDELFRFFDTKYDGKI